MSQIGKQMDRHTHNTRYAQRQEHNDEKYVGPKTRHTNPPALGRQHMNLGPNSLKLLDSYVYIIKIPITSAFYFTYLFIFTKADVATR